MGKLIEQREIEGGGGGMKRGGKGGSGEEGEETMKSGSISQVVWWSLRVELQRALS